MTNPICPQPPASATVVRTPNRPQNENTNSIVLNIPAHPTQMENCRSEIALAPQPFKLSVETTTDWATVFATLLVGIGSTLTALLVGWLSYANQRSQIQSTITNFRHAWMVELRQALSRFVALAAKINYEIKHDADYLHKTESNGIYSELMQTHTSVLLMLDAEKQYTEDLGLLMKDIEDALRANDEEKFSESTARLTQKANSVLEGAWRDIKRDLRKPGKWTRDDA
jgi:hypothetical protein